MTHILNLNSSTLIKQYILHPKHSFESTDHAPEAPHLMLGGEMLKCLQNLKTNLNQKLFWELGLLGLTRTIKIKQAQIIAFWNYKYAITALIRLMSFTWFEVIDPAQIPMTVYCPTVLKQAIV